MDIVKLLPAIYALIGKSDALASIVNDVLAIVDKVMKLFGVEDSKPLDVRWLQTRLAELGFDPGPVDGSYGSLTKAAVAAFQESHGDLTVDGWAGPATMAAMLGGSGMR